MLTLIVLSAACLATEPLDIAVLNVEGLAQEEAGIPGWPAVGIDGLSDLPVGTLLVLPKPNLFPAIALSPLVAFIDKGGHVVAVGGPPFETLVYRRSDGVWLDRESSLAETPASHPLIDWDTANAGPVRRSTGNPAASIAYKPLPDGYRADLRIPEAASWEMRELRCVKVPPEGDDVLRFRASGDGRATALIVEVREQDGSRWMATVPLTGEEREIGIHRSAFKFWYDGSPANRGGAGDMPDFAHIAALQIGFAASHQMLHAGRYLYTIRGLATGRCSAEVITPSLPKLEGFSPPYKLFTARPARCTAEGEFSETRLDVPATILSAIARPMHETADRTYFWQPHFKAFNTEGIWCATPFSTMWNRNGATWSLLGWQPEADELKALISTLAEVLANGKPVTFPPELEDDRAQGTCVTVSRRRFVLDGKPWFAHGINFWPLYVAGMEPPEYYSHWLKRADYIPELVEQDLVTLGSLGVNLVSIQYEHVEEAPQLRDLLTRCGRHGIKANIFLRGSHPLQPSATDDLSQRPFLELMRAADLRGNPHVFAYDLAWEPRMGAFKERHRFDPLWRTWLAEQYGTVERAETVWGCPLSQIDGEITGPTDEQLIQDGPHRVMVAAYRRFADDLISRRYGDIVRLARTVDDTHLFGVRTGYGGTGTQGVARVMPFQLTSGAAHLDFLSPEGYGYGPDNISDAGLVTAYARWAGNGKPVFWAEFGRSVLNGGQDALDTQRALYASFADMIRLSGADGWAGWWYPGGLRVDEHSDYGIIAPDRSLRPASLLLRERADVLKALDTHPPVETAIVANRDAASTGLAGLIARHSAVYAEGFNAGRALSIVTAATGTTSRDCPLTGVGGVPFESPGPPEYLNAELRLTVRPSEGYEVEAVNTGEAAWRKDDCVLLAEWAERTETLPLQNDVARFQTTTFSLPEPEPRRIVMHTTRFGEFGQRLKP